MKNALKNKKVYCFGDSITYFDGLPFEGFQGGKIALDGYQHILRKAGAEVYTFGNRGATIRKYHETDDMLHESLLDDIRSADISNTDIITFFAGTNDVGRGFRKGAITSDFENFDESTTAGALESVLLHFRKNNPSCRIVVISPFYSALDNRPKELISELCEIMELAAKKHGTGFINLFNESKINESNHEKYLFDGLHPNNDGYALIGKVILDFLLK